MSNLKQILYGTVILIMLTASIALSGGYQLNEQGARAVGMGGAFVATASDPSAIYYNPAGLTSQRGINLLLGGNIILPSTTFKGPTPLTLETSTNSQMFTPINLYGTYQVNDKIVVGLGVFNPFGLGTEWPEDWVGRQLAVKSDLQTWYINPSVGYKISDQLSVGVGVSYVTGSIKLNMKTPVAPGVYRDVKLDGTGNGLNVNFGVICKPMEGLSIGASYRLKTDLEFSGDFVTPLGTQSGKATLPMPGNLQVGIAYDITPELTIEGDLQFIQWSAYDTLTLTNNAGAVMLKSGKDWVDNVALRGGAEYRVDEETTLRAGVILDLTPQPPSKAEPMLPDADRLDISFGGSYKINENLSIDAAYMLVMFMERDAKTAALPGIYNSTAHIISVNLGYAF